MKLQSLSYLLLLLTLTSCAMKGEIATLDSFNCILIGISETELTAQMGQPYATCKTRKGTVEYEYIERIKMGRQEIEQRHYFIEIQDGQVVSKRMVRETYPTYLYNSYEYQTASGHSS